MAGHRRGNLLAAARRQVAARDQTDRQPLRPCQSCRRWQFANHWTHLFGNNVEANINGGYVQSLGTQSGIVATVTGNGTVVPTIGNQSWFEYGGRLGFRITKGWVADLFVNGTAGPQPVGNTLHGCVGLRVSY